MNSNLNQDKMYDIEKALKLKDEGKRLSYIINKFSNCESEIREVFGTVAFLKENAEKIAAPVNIFKTMLSKIPENSPIQFETRFKKEIKLSNINADVSKMEDNEKTKNNGLPMSESENNNMFGRWKIIVSVIILAIITLFILFQSDSKKDSTGENIESSQNSDELSSASSVGDLSSSVNNEARR